MVVAGWAECQVFRVDPDLDIDPDPDLNHDPDPDLDCDVDVDHNLIVIDSE